MTDPRLCANPACAKPLDAQRVARHDARTCDDKCRAAAWKASVGYGKRSAPRKGRSHGNAQPQQPRRGVTVYFPDPDQAEFVRRLAENRHRAMVPPSTYAATVAEILAKALDRHRRKVTQ